VYISLSTQSGNFWIHPRSYVCAHEFSSESRNKLQTQSWRTKPNNGHELLHVTTYRWTANVREGDIPVGRSEHEGPYYSSFPDGYHVSAAAFENNTRKHPRTRLGMGKESQGSTGQETDNPHVLKEFIMLYNAREVNVCWGQISQRPSVLCMASRQEGVERACS
jgi:hypothetical protein